MCTFLKDCERKGIDINTTESVKFEVLACEKVVYEGGLGLRALGTAHHALVPLRYNLALKTKSAVVPTPVDDSPKMPFGIRCAPRRDEATYKDVRNAETDGGLGTGPVGAAAVDESDGDAAGDDGDAEVEIDGELDIPAGDRIGIISMDKVANNTRARCFCCKENDRGAAVQKFVRGDWKFWWRSKRAKLEKSLRASCVIGQDIMPHSTEDQRRQSVIFLRQQMKSASDDSLIYMLAQSIRALQIDWP